MTAFEPPDFTYFTGLQFNPSIYENPLTETISIPSNPTFNSVTTPIVYTDEIQRYTASIINMFNSPAVVAVYMGLATTLFNIGNIAIIGSNIFPNGTSEIALGATAADTIIQALTCYIIADAAFELTSGASTKVRVEPTLAYIRAATTTIRDTASNILASFTSSAIGFTTALLEVVQGATTTMSLTEASTTFRNTTDWAVFAPVSILKDQLGNNRLYVTSSFTNITNTSIRIFSAVIECIPFSPATTFSFNFKTNTANDTITTSSIVANGGTTANTGTLTLTAGTSTIAGTTTNLNATTTNIDGTTLNMSSTTTAFPDATRLTFFSDNGAYPFYDSGRRYILVSAATTISNLTTTFDTIFVVPYANTTTFQISLQGVATNINSGNSFRIFNNGSVAITIATTNSTNRLVGPAIARAGTGTYSLASNASVRIQTLIPSSNPFNQVAANAGAYFLSLC